VTEQYYSQFSDDLRRIRYDDEDLEQEFDRRRQERGVKQARPGQAWYDEPQRSRTREFQDQEGRQSYHGTNDRNRRNRPRQWRDEAWWSPGPYEGLGPRGYRRSTETIQEEVCNLLTQHGQIDASQVTVQVQDGDVILTGKVSSRKEKRLAEDLAASISGVHDVQNRLRQS
jgi:hypothetical protein